MIHQPVPAPQARPWQTYFILNRALSRVKIGKSRDVHRRRHKDLQRGAGTDLVILGVLDGDQETQHHKMFSRYRVHGEWFGLSDELARWLRRRFGVRIAAPVTPKAPAPQLLLSRELEAHLPYKDRDAGDWRNGPAEELLDYLMALADRRVAEEDAEEEENAEDDDDDYWLELEDSYLAPSRIREFLFHWESHLISWTYSDSAAADPDTDPTVTIACWLPLRHWPVTRLGIIDDALIVDDCNGCCLPATIRFLFVDPETHEISTAEDYYDPPPEVTDEERRAAAEALNRWAARQSPVGASR